MQTITTKGKAPRRTKFSSSAILNESIAEKIERLKKQYTDTIWTRYQVSWFFITPLCASVPTDKSLMEKWLASRQPKVRPPGGRSIAEINEEVAATIPEQEEEAEISKLTFQRIDGACHVRGATIRAHIKDCASQLSRHYVGKIEKEASFAVRVKNGLYLDWLVHRWIPILRHDGTIVIEPDGEREKTVHTQPRMGPINALKVFDEIHDARLDFEVLVLGGNKKAVVKQDDLETIFKYGSVHGYGGERSEDGGKYVFELREV